MILCFSATGNSQYCADVLARATELTARPSGIIILYRYEVGILSSGMNFLPGKHLLCKAA